MCVRTNFQLPELQLPEFGSIIPITPLQISEWFSIIFPTVPHNLGSDRDRSRVDVCQRDIEDHAFNHQLVRDCQVIVVGSLIELGQGHDHEFTSLVRLCSTCIGVSGCLGLLNMEKFKLNENSIERHASRTN